MRTGRQGWLPVALTALVAVGCKATPVPDYQTWAEKEPAYAPSTSSSNAFDDYALAARRAEADGEKWLSRTYFTPAMKEDLLEAMQPALRELRRGTRKASEFKFIARPPFEPAPYQAGWSLLRKALVWSVERNVKEKNWNAAVEDTVTATRFGFDLLGGSATDASLGLATLDGARAALAPHLNQLDRSQLARLSEGLQNALEQKPPLAITLQNEHKNMLMAVQYVQDAYKANEFTTLQKELGPDVREGVDYLRELRKRDIEERPSYFKGFAAESELETNWTLRQAELPAKEREEKGPDYAEHRPWKRLSKHFFRASRPLLKMHDGSLARTRMLILHAEIQRSLKTSGLPPKTLGQLKPELTIDPYTGLPFIYKTDGPIYALYSVGANFRDDGGVTDSSFRAPDLLIEANR